MSGLQQPTPEQGREWAERELSDPRYSEVDISFFGKIKRMLDLFFQKLAEGVDNAQSPWFIIGVILFTAAVVGFVIWRVRRGTDDDFSKQLFEMDSEFTGVEPRVFRKLAHEAAENGNWADATANQIRAVFAELNKKRIIDVEAASTAAELAAAASAALPAISDKLNKAASLFDRIVFGSHPADEADYRFAEQLDSATQALRAPGQETADSAEAADSRDSEQVRA